MKSELSVKTCCSLLTDILLHSQDAMIFLSNSFEILKINSSTTSLLNFDETDVIGKNYFTVFSARGIEPILKLKNPVSSHKFEEINQTLVCSDGSKKHIKWKIYYIFEDEGDRKFYLLLGNDCSKEVLLEYEYNSLRIFLENLISQVPEYIYWKDRSFSYLGCNNLLAEMAGLESRDEIVGKTDKDFGWPLERVKSLYEIDRNIIDTGKGVVIEEDIPLPKDGVRTMISHKVPLRDENQKTVGILGISIDITERKRMEEQLKISQKLAESASQAKTEFIANMSHDVKTPLSGMIAFSELLTARVQPDLRELASGVATAGKQLMVFFENCIELSKLENASLVLSKENFSLKQLLKELTLLFKPSVISRNLSLDVDYSDKIPSNLLGSRVALYRIILNLMGNALKFTKKGSIKISAELVKKSTSDQVIIKLIVADTGIGIPKNKQQLIFERFSRVTTSYESVEGHGIGLHLVQKFVDAMGGEISLKSEEDKGSQFIVVVPLGISLDENNYEDDSQISFPPIVPQNNIEHVENTPPTLNQLSEKITSPEGNRPNILLVEDNPMAQTGGRLILESLNCDVDIAASGKEAINLFKPGKYCLVFMDIGLPDMKGYEVSKRLREMEKNTSFHAPILGLSAHATQDEKELSSNAGMEEMMSKPLLFGSANKILVRYHIINELPALEGDISNPPDASVGKSGLKVINLEKITDNTSPKNKLAWTMLNNLFHELQEMRTELEPLYDAHDIKTLLDKVHKLHGGLCYTNTPDLLEATRALELNLKKGKLDKSNTFYQDFLQAIDNFERVFRAA